MPDLMILPRLVITVSPQRSRAGPAEKWHGVAVFTRVSSICSSVNVGGVRTCETYFFVASNRLHSSTASSTFISPSWGIAHFAPSSYFSHSVF
jgi:hypothetical protein